MCFTPIVSAISTLKQWAQQFAASAERNSQYELALEGQGTAPSTSHLRVEGGTPVGEHSPVYSPAVLARRRLFFKLLSEGASLDIAAGVCGFSVRAARRLAIRAGFHLQSIKRSGVAS